MITLPADLLPERLRRFIDAALCPWCADGHSWVSLASHVVQAHGIPARYLRIMAGLKQGASICSPELSEAFREMCIATGKRPSGSNAGHAQRATPIKTAANVAKARLMNASPEAASYRAAGRAVAAQRRGHQARTRTTCEKGHELTEANTYESRGGRRCRTCRAAAGRARRERVRRG